jgi:hypothetical protein
MSSELSLDFRRNRKQAGLANAIGVLPDKDTAGKSFPSPGNDRQAAVHPRCRPFYASLPSKTGIAA